MANSDELRARVETTLKEYLGVDTLVTDAEGDYPVRAGSAKYFVRLNDDDPASVTVYAHVLVGVTATPKLYETLNAVNGFIRFGRMFHQGDAVLASAELVAATLDPEELSAVCRSIAGLADHYDDLFQGEFGGRRDVDDESQPENAAATN